MIVTVVTPTLNGAAYLRECIESAQRNNTPGIEVEHIIVDGGSTDGTVELAQSYGLRVLTGKDRGIFDAINKGSFASSGELLGFLGSDDVMLDGALEAVVQAWRSSGRRWVVGGIRWIDERGRSLGQLAAPPAWISPRTFTCLGWNPIMHMGTYLSREFFYALQGFDIDYKDSGDYEMFARALSAAPYARVARPIACFRRTGMNNSSVNVVRTARENDQVLATFGPKGHWERRAWRAVLRCWLNFGNPSWLVHKMSEPARVALGFQERAYF